ncbi:unnamed protein product [Thelazia callipaeda]|uniref:Molybdopterin converting factor subunit 1 n=1 Tax=Thelazia callipaeda TaxID=103827 RepID=A0A0N5CTC6_THECL|nr:unnamed protein product [Thelazia callipaeda]
MFVKLQRAITREIGIRYKLAEIRGMMELVIQASEINSGTIVRDQANEEVFGEAVVMPIPFVIEGNNDN